MSSSSPTYQEEIHTPSTTNWTVVLFVAVGIIVVVTLVAVFFVIPKYAQGAFGSRVNSDMNKFNLGNNNTIAVGEPNPSGYNCTKDIYNCGNFTTQAQAQVAFDACNATAGDIFQLDGDGNGKACESLPLK